MGFVIVETRAKPGDYSGRINFTVRMSKNLRARVRFRKETPTSYSELLSAFDINAQGISRDALIMERLAKTEQWESFWIKIIATLLQVIF